MSREGVAMGNLARNAEACLPNGELISRTPAGAQRAAIYCRVSTKPQAKGGSAGRRDERHSAPVSREDSKEQESSLETQEAACQQYAAIHGYAVSSVFREIHTGTELWERPMLSDLRQRVRERDVDAVICYAIDRFARDPVHLGVLISEADHARVAVRFVTEPLDDSPEGELIRFVRGYAAKVEHEKIRERSIRGKRALVKAGRPMLGGTPPYGYRWRDGACTHFEHDPDTSAWARRIFEWAASGTTLRGIAIKLNEAGVATPRNPGARWGHTTLTRILANPTYGGKRAGFRYVTSKNKAGGTTMRLRPEAEQIPLPDDVAPALVTWDTFQAVQDRLRLNRQQASRNNRYPEVALLRAGYARCGHCGGTMNVKKVGPGGRYYHYRCIRGMAVTHACQGASIPTHDLDPAVWERVQDILTRPEIVERELARMQTDDPMASDLALVDRSLADARRQQRNLVDQLANLGGTVAALVSEKLAALEEQAARLQSEREAILTRQATWEAAQHRLADLQEWCRDVGARLGTLTYAEKRIALEALGVEARVWRAGHTPRFEITMRLPLDDIVDAASRRWAGRTTRPPSAGPPARD